MFIHEDKPLEINHLVFKGGVPITPTIQTNTNHEKRRHESEKWEGPKIRQQSRFQQTQGNKDT